MSVSILEDHTFNGRWSRVGGAIRDVPGRLTFTPADGAHLSLDGVFDDRAGFDRVGSADQTIHGVTNSGQCITIFNCFLRRRSGSLEHPLSEYRGHLIAIGDHFESYQDLRFKRVFAAYHNLEEVLGLTGLCQTIEHTKTEMDVTIQFKRPPSLRVEIPPFSIETGFSWRVAGDRFHRLSFSQQGQFLVSTAEATHLDEFRGGPLRSLHNLVELAAGAVLPPTLLEASREIDEDVPRIEFLMQPIGYKPMPLRRRMGECLFTLAGLGTRFPEYVQRWHAGRERFGPTFDLFFSLDRLEMFQEHKFLSLIQAVEAYHRRAFANVALPEQEHRKRVDRVLEAVTGTLSAEEMEWVRGKLEFNEPSLRARLRELYDKLPPSAKKALPPRSKFIDETAETRHHMTHWKEREEGGRVLHGGHELLRAIQQLRLVLKCIFLAELGLTDAKTVEHLPELRLLSAIKGE
jgi:hypothetical protein